MKRIQGSLTIEAALVLPVFLMFVFTFVFLFKIIYIHEQFQHAITDTAGQMATGAYLLDKTGLLDIEQELYQGATEKVDSFTESGEDLAITLSQMVSYHPDESGTETLDTIRNLFGFIEMIVEDADGIILSLGVEKGLPLVNQAIGNRIAAALVNCAIPKEAYEKWGIVGGSSGMDYSLSRYMLGDEDITIVVQYQIQMPFFPSIFGNIKMQQQVRVRAFTGNENFESIYKVSPVKKGEGEGDSEDGDLVYITKNSDVYHTNRGCRYIDVKVVARTYGEIMGIKRPCEVCGKIGEELNVLNVIYTTDKSLIYHTSLECSEVKRTVTTITLKEAMTRGLRICTKCGGEGK